MKNKVLLSSHIILDFSNRMMVQNFHFSNFFPVQSAYYAITRNAIIYIEPTYLPNEEHIANIFKITF